MRGKRKRNRGLSSRDRLLAAGYSRKQAIEMIGSALVEEIWAILHDQKPFDRVRSQHYSSGWAKASVGIPFAQSPAPSEHHQDAL